MSESTKEVTMKVVVLSEQAPQGNSSAAFSWGSSIDGTEMVTWLKEGQWYGYLQGISQGNWFEGEDQGPFDTREEAEASLREDYAESQQPQPDIYPLEDE
jgi:hypothetical protein